jgi:hypothetical protein
MDPRGLPFKQRILSFILALRPSQRDPLVTKINEVCLKNRAKSYGEPEEQYINLAELDI